MRSWNEQARHQNPDHFGSYWALHLDRALQRAVGDSLMVKKYRDVQVIDLLCIYEVQGEETPCDADNQEVVIESATYEWLTGTL